MTSQLTDDLRRNASAWRRSAPERIDAFCGSTLPLGLNWLRKRNGSTKQVRPYDPQKGYGPLAGGATLSYWPNGQRTARTRRPESTGWSHAAFVDADLKDYFWVCRSGQTHDPYRKTDRRWQSAGPHPANAHGGTMTRRARRFRPRGEPRKGVSSRRF